MASFVNCNTKCIAKYSNGISPRGGCSLVMIDDKLIAFGGANREQEHFNDLWVLKRKAFGKRYCNDLIYLLTMSKIEASGDVPPSRSGHACCAFGKNMFLFGGIDFENEAVYNDLYVLNTDTMEWRYAGESGEVVTARNSHSLGVVKGSDGSNYLVVFGGASPELGPLGDLYYASLPQDSSAILPEDFFVTWTNLEVTNSSQTPTAREMHSTAFYQNSMIICGGRNADAVLSDVWVLESDSSPSCTSSPTSPGAPLAPLAPLAPFRWRQVHQNEYMLQVPRCAHTSAVVNGNIYIFGGFTGQGISGDVSYLPASCLLEIPSPPPGTRPASTWRDVIADGEIPGRFGHAMSLAPSWLKEVSCLTESNQSVDTSTSAVHGFIVFCGIDAFLDYNDLWLVQPLIV